MILIGKRDVVVTTPKSEMENAAEEARQCIEEGGGFYFRTFRNRPKYLDVGSKIFYVEDGYVRGYGIVSEVVEGSQKCSITERDWGEGFHAFMPADSWCWIKPIPMTGFQGYRYFNEKVEVVGDWLDPKPKI